MSGDAPLSWIILDSLFAVRNPISSTSVKKGNLSEA